MSDKFNTIIDTGRDHALCVQVDKPISKEGYEQNFLPKAITILEKYGVLRLLIYFKDHKGWEEDAALLDLKYTALYADKIKKMALVNMPKSEKLQHDLKSKLIKGEYKLFEENDLDEAIEWVHI